MNFFIKMNKINHQLCWLIYVLFICTKGEKNSPCDLFTWPENMSKEPSP